MQTKQEKLRFAFFAILVHINKLLFIMPQSMFYSFCQLSYGLAAYSSRFLYHNISFIVLYKYMDRDNFQNIDNNDMWSPKFFIFGIKKFLDPLVIKTEIFAGRLKVKSEKHSIIIRCTLHDDYFNLCLNHKDAKEESKTHVSTTNKI